MRHFVILPQKILKKQIEKRPVGHHNFLNRTMGVGNRSSNEKTLKRPLRQD
jgi:hypothetical protein